MYALYLDENQRVLCATYDKYAPDNPKVEKLPDGDISDYRYIYGEYIYDPLPLPAPVETQPTQLEQRVAALESANDDIILMMADLIGG